MDLNFLRQFSKIDIVGHRNADFDSRISCHLMKYALTNYGIDAEVVIPDGIEDPWFKEKAKEIGFEYQDCTNFRDDSVLVLVDHVAYYQKRIIACFDHHPDAVPEVMPYIDIYRNTDKTCCGLLIYEAFEALGLTFPDVLTKLTVYGCHIDSLSFKSSKALPVDHEWCKKQILKYGMDEAEIIRFGYGLTDRNLPFAEYVRTGTKVYEVGEKHFGASYAIVENDNDDLFKIASELRHNLNDDMIAWCFIVSNVAKNYTTIMVITNEYVLTHTVHKLLSRGKDIVPALRAFLSAKNDGTVTKMLIERKLQIATMESCTSGLIASNITDYEGASAILKGSDIAYSNEAKVKAGVSKAIIDEFGVYSPQTATAMAMVAKDSFHSDIGVGITGSFGNVDPENSDSKKGNIYFNITLEEPSFHLSYWNSAVHRKAMKQRTVDIVLSTLQIMLTKF